MISSTGETFSEGYRVSRGAEQQYRIIGGSDAIGHDQGIEVDRLSGNALLLWRRLGDGQGAGLEMLASLGPRQRRIVFRVAGLTDVDDHVPDYGPFGGAL